MKITCRSSMIELLSKKDLIRKKHVLNFELIVNHPLELPLRRDNEILFTSPQINDNTLKIYEADTEENAKQIIKDLKRAYKLNIKEVAIRDNEVRLNE